MASPTQWTWVWVNSGSWWWTEMPGMLWFMGSQRVGHNWTTELTELNWQSLFHHRFPTWRTDIECWLIITLTIINKSKAKQQGCIQELHSFVNVRSDFFANCFWILEKNYLDSLGPSPRHCYRDNILLCLFCLLSIFSITFLSLDNQQNNISHL